MIGSPIFELERVDSTNEYASTLLTKTKLAEGTVIWAHEQFAGKGQNNNKWESEPGKNLTFTIILKPHFLSPTRQFLLNKAISLGVLDFIHTHLFFSDSDMPAGSVARHHTEFWNHLLQIKWPNDIYIDSHKIAGILIENQIRGNLIDTSVAGIGVNINQTEYGKGIPNPVSLVQLLRREMELKEAMQSICQSLESRYHLLREGKIPQLDIAYNQNLLGFDQWRAFMKDGNKLEGKICGVDEIGRLMIQLRDETVQTYNHKEIEYIL